MEQRALGSSSEWAPEEPAGGSGSAPPAALSQGRRDSRVDTGREQDMDTDRQADSTSAKEVRDIQGADRLPDSLVLDHREDPSSLPCRTRWWKCLPGSRSSSMFCRGNWPAIRLYTMPILLPRPPGSLPVSSRSARPSESAVGPLRRSRSRYTGDRTGAGVDVLSASCRCLWTSSIRVASSGFVVSFDPAIAPAP